MQTGAKMLNQSFCQEVVLIGFIFTAIGIVLTCFGGYGVHHFGKIEAYIKENDAKQRIDELQIALTLAVEENAELVAKSTEKAVEENAKKTKKG